MEEKDLNKFFDKIISVREDIQKLIKEFNKVSIEEVRNRFLHLAFQLQKKKGDIEVNKKRLVELILESIEVVQRHIDYATDSQPPDKKFEAKEIWKEIKDKQIKLSEEVETEAGRELDKIINYIKDNRHKLIWAYMLNYPESDLWQLVGDIGVETFERIFISKVQEGGQKFIFPNKKDLLTKGKQNIARYLKEKVPNISLEKISEIINNQYEGEFIDERELKYWIYEKETQGIIEKPLSPEKDSRYVLIIDFEDNPELNTKIFNAIQRRVFDKKFQDYLIKRAKEDRRFARDKGKRKTVGRG